MSFTSVSFFLFFPLTLALAWLVPGRRQNAALLAASYAFYACNTPAWLPLLVLDSAATWALCRRMDAAQGAVRRRRLLGVLGVNLGLLAGVKVLGAALRGLAPDSPSARALEGLGLSGGGDTFSLVLPLGISFFTVQSIGYAVDVYRQAYAPERSFVRFALFVSFFPLIASGPIARSAARAPCAPTAPRTRCSPLRSASSPKWLSPICWLCSRTRCSGTCAPIRGFRSQWACSLTASSSISIFPAIH